MTGCTALFVRALAALSVAAAASSTVAEAQPAPVAEIAPGILAGYLPLDALPNSLALLPPPPAAGSAAFTGDEEFSRKTFALRGTPRWTLAIADSDSTFPQAASIFSCVLSASITEQETPHLYMLMRRSLTDVVLSTNAAKNKYNRTRPFVVNKEPVCTPDEEAQLVNDGSYPSGGAAVGWAWALILSEIAPDRANAILARGRNVGRSRVICNAHWESDVIQGGVMGAATVARLHANDAFLADLTASKTELEAIRARGFKSTRDCASEAAAISLDPSPAP